MIIAPPWRSNGFLFALQGMVHKHENAISSGKEVTLMNRWMIALSIWEWYSRISGVLLISLALAYGVISLFASDGRVWEASNVRLLTPVVRVGETVSYIVTLKANESCSGFFVAVMQSSTNHGPPATVTFRRPLMRPGISTENMTNNIELPESVTPGEWDVVHSIESRCPKRVKIDEIVRYRIRVTP